MNRLSRTLSMIFIFCFLASEGAYAAPQPPLEEAARLIMPSRPESGDTGYAHVLEPELARVLLETRPDEHLRVIVYLREQGDPELMVTGAENPVGARSRLVSALRTVAGRSQALLLAYLAGAQSAGLVETYTPFWIFNGVAVSARPSFIRTLALHPDVASIRLDHYRRWLPEPVQQLPERGEASGPASALGVEWGVSRVRADQVWHMLNISGSHAVVASMDTGVDWLHPALHTSYRGYNPHGLHNHLYNWYDATNSGATYPVDGHGHGTHTMGTIVGQGGIGVAPGARWIAVRVLNNEGYGYDSWIHQGFQWLLAPGGDPARAPDAVNCSWGNPNGALESFRPDLRALRAAGIFVAFAAGNNGPAYGTVNSPASMPEAFAVGASDQDDEVAYFSSRGPSPWREIRPHVVAPGVQVRSSTPGGAYASTSGTSVATPHVVGVAALLRSISPTLSVDRLAHLITSTAVPVNTPHPNNHAGWGRLDGLAAATALARPGFISGAVRQVGNNTPVVGAQVEAIAYQAGGGSTTTAADGTYLLALTPGMYDLTASAFGYAPETVRRLLVVTDTKSVVDFALTRLPAGTVRGRVTDATTGQPITAAVSVLDTPVETVADAYDFELPAGVYTLSARRMGYRVVTTTAVVQAGQVISVNLALPRAPSILLVDSGAWYYGSQAAYFRQALDDLGYAYDTWRIKHPPADLPPSSTLSTYNIVVWSAPLDSPGYLDADGALEEYLDGGGRLLLSGQDIGFWDGGGALGYWSDYYRDYLKASLVSDDAPARVLYGVTGDLFAGLTITITGPGGADNQLYPDEVEVADTSSAAAVWAYHGGAYGGIRAGTCLNYRSMYFSFGFEAIADRAARQEVMRRAIEWLVTPPPQVGLELTVGKSPKVGLPGDTVTHTVEVRHTGQGGVNDTVLLSLEGADWATQLNATSLRLAPCTTATVLVSVTIPSNLLWNAQDIVTLTARSTISQTLLARATLTTKTPAPILLVDDDRWYNQEARYEAALRATALPYDYWRTGQNGREQAGSSPSLQLLRLYPIVVWYTGYDWYAPVTREEEAILRAYLDEGGRLFLSSQDFLYYHHGDPLARMYLGVADCTEDVTPTLATGVPENPISGWLGPYHLDYPFRNFSDAVVPAPGVSVVFRELEHRPIALSNRASGYRTVFFSFPFEALPEAARPEVMEQAIGWLSWLGGSTFSADRQTVSPGATLTYTARLRNDGPQPVGVSFSNTLPITLTLVPGSLTGAASYLPSMRRVFWEGRLVPGEEVTFTYQVTISAEVPAGSSIINTASLGLEEQGIHLRRSEIVRVGGADLSPSKLRCAPAAVRPGGCITCVLSIVNSGPDIASTAQAVILLPADSRLVSGSLSWTGWGTAELLTDTLIWRGRLAVGEEITLTYQVSVPTAPLHPPVYSVALLQDGAGGMWERQAWVLWNPWRLYLPAVYKAGM